MSLSKVIGVWIGLSVLLSVAIGNGGFLVFAFLKRKTGKTISLVNSLVNLLKI